MPELPEVETIVRQLRNYAIGRRIDKAELLRESMLKRSTLPFDDFFRNCSFAKIDRRGKYIIFSLDNGSRLLAHLGMTGKFVVSENENTADKHLCSRYIFDDGGCLDHIDIRRFGRLETYRENESIPVLERLGIEPLSDDFDASSLKAVISTRNGKTVRTRAIHTLLMDQRLIAGVGNIYASEALFRAGIRPVRKASRVKKKELPLLAESLKKVMEESLEEGGTTVSDYRRVDDKPGNFKEFLRVYGRAGEPCRKCGTEIKRIRLNGRSAFFCPECQR